ncbi:hypothetical protein [Bosea sp. BIWAKO-01]|nr:hypothetical protein [Bosea sp. BIWAKO-01]
MVLAIWSCAVATLALGVVVVRWFAGRADVTSPDQLQHQSRSC